MKALLIWLEKYNSKDKRIFCLGEAGVVRIEGVCLPLYGKSAARHALSLATRPVPPPGDATRH
ncbi:MAG: hypothetical protein NZM43_12520, partial [Saprospiraceae bacterium]|nr:hypothetical protein [Saprospiraceae bacterium]MDW8485136.1 hypothetical protein [Saprospiraceae bacterium]